MANYSTKVRIGTASAGRLNSYTHSNAGGSVTYSGAISGTINDGNEHTLSYSATDYNAVILTANANSGYEFYRFYSPTNHSFYSSGGLASNQMGLPHGWSNSQLVAPPDIVAIFCGKRYGVSVSCPNENVTVGFTNVDFTGTKTSYSLPSGASITLSASINAVGARDYRIAGWTCNGTPISNSSAQMTVTTPASSATYSPILVARAAEVRSSDSALGTASILDEQGNSCGTSEFLYGHTSLTLSARTTPNAGIPIAFTGWFVGDDLVSLDADFVYEVPPGYDNIVFVARFKAADPFPVNVAVGGSGASTAGNAVAVTSGIRSPTPGVYHCIAHTESVAFDPTCWERIADPAAYDSSATYTYGDICLHANADNDIVPWVYRPHWWCEGDFVEGGNWQEIYEYYPGNEYGMDLNPENIFADPDAEPEYCFIGGVEGYYEGVLTITASVASGWEIAGWQVDGNYVDASGQESESPHRGATLQYLLDGYLDETTTPKTPHTITCVFSEKKVSVTTASGNSPASGSYGTVAAFAYDDDQESWQPYAAAGENAGTPIKVVATAAAAGTKLIRAILTTDGTTTDVTADFGSPSGATIEVNGGSVTVNAYTYGGTTGNGAKTATGDMSFVIYWGTTVSASRYEHSVSAGTTAASVTTGDFAIGLSQTGAATATSMDVEYGQRIWLRASNPSSGMFVGWFDLSKTPYYLTTPLSSGVGDQRAVEVQVASPSVTYAALFADGAWWKYVRLYCDPATQYVSVALAAASGTYAGTVAIGGTNYSYIEEVGESAFETGLASSADFDGRTQKAAHQIATPNTGQAGHSAASSGGGGDDEPPATPVYDAYYKILAGTPVTITATPTTRTARLASWNRKDYATDETFYDEAVLSTSSPATFTVGMHTQIRATATNSGLATLSLAILNIGNNAGAECRVYATPSGYDEETVGQGYTAQFIYGSSVTAVAVPASGYKFEGWFEQSGGTFEKKWGGLNYTFPITAARTLYAKFVEDVSAVFLWEGGSENKTMIWRSRRFVSAQPTNLSAVAVHADGYPEEDPPLIAVFYASSPDGDASMATTEPIPIESQDARRLPVLRPEKYVEIEVTSSQPVLRVAASTSMAGLNG